MYPRETWPRTARRGIAAGYRRYRAATGFLRSSPDFLIIGAQRSGTSSLHAMLSDHPQIHSGRIKEVHYFDLNHWRGEWWYRGHFPTRAALAADGRRTGMRPIVGEATPYYLYHPEAAARAYDLLPDARLIAILRDPVERAISHYHHEVARGTETLPLEQALDAEQDRLHGTDLGRRSDSPYRGLDPHQRYSYLDRGQYAPQLRRWLAAYPREQLLVVFSAELFSRPKQVLPQILRHIGVSGPLTVPEVLHQNARDYPRGQPDLRARLRAAFRDSDRDLAKITGRPPPWAS